MPVGVGAWEVYTIGSYVWDLYFKVGGFLSGSELSPMLAALLLFARGVVVKTMRSFSS